MVGWFCADRHQPNHWCWSGFIARRVRIASDEHFCEFADELHVHSGGRDQHQHRHLSGEPAGRHHRHGIGDGEPKAEGVAGDGANDLQRTVWAGAVAGEPDRT